MLQSEEAQDEDAADKDAEEGEEDGMSPLLVQSILYYLIFKLQ